MKSMKLPVHDAPYRFDFKLRSFLLQEVNILNILQPKFGYAFSNLSGIKWTRTLNFYYPLSENLLSYSKLDLQKLKVTLLFPKLTALKNATQSAQQLAHFPSSNCAFSLHVS